MVVDAHAHAIPPALVDRLRTDGHRVGVQVRQLGGELSIEHREGYWYPLTPEFTSVGPILARMDRAGIDHTILSIAPTLFFYALGATEGEALCRTVNEGLIELAEEGGGRLSVMLSVPLQDPARAAAEVARLVSVETVRGVEIGTRVEATELDDPSLEPFYHACEQAGLPLFLHSYYLGSRPRLEPYYLTNTLGNPIDTTIAVARLIHGGVLERHPRLRVLLAHGGGFYPYQRGRMAHAFAVRREPRERSQRSPSSFSGQIYFDTLLHHGPALRFLVEAEGAGRVVLGSDAPFDMGSAEPRAMVDAAELSPEARERVLGGTARELFGLG